MSQLFARGGLVKRLVAVATVLAVIALAGGCSGSGDASTTAGKPAAKGPAEAPLAFGTASTLTSDAGVVKVSITAPKAATLHALEYDPTCKISPRTCNMPGPVVLRGVVATVTWTGVSGAVDATTLYQFSYVSSDGSTVPAKAPGNTYETFDPMSAHATTLYSGDTVRGAIAFNGVKPGGRIVVRRAGTTAATFA
jgi:hypothetical protein